jgi:hypothetical protein
VEIDVEHPAVARRKALTAARRVMSQQLGEVMRTRRELGWTFGRNVCLGGAASALIVLSQIIQVGPGKSFLLDFSVIACAVAMQIFIALAILYEFSLLLGDTVSKYGRIRIVERFAITLFLVASSALIAAIGLGTWYLSTVAGVVFFAATFLWRSARYCSGGPAS